MTNYKEQTNSITHLILDPNNYRFQDSDDYVAAKDNRFHEPSVQSKAYIRLREDNLLPLKNSILRNGFLPVEKIICKDYEFSEGLYIVIEGNRRVAALKWIDEDHDAGVEVPESVLESINNIPVIIIEQTPEDPAYIEALMGIRHVSGIKQWGGYQRAKLVATLKDHYNLESGEISERLAMSTVEVNRRYRAFKALQQMILNEEYSDEAKPEMYPVFHEAVSVPSVREWLDWDPDSAQFKNEEQLTNFYDLITPSEIEDNRRKDAKITTYQEVRELRAILSNDSAKRDLLDPSKTFLDALTIAKSEEISKAWKGQVSSAIQAIGSIGAIELKNLNVDDLKLIQSLREVVIETLEAHQKLKV